jgi:predicted lipoprotein with Yx(FWY)xxD motif
MKIGRSHFAALTALALGGLIVSATALGEGSATRAVSAVPSHALVRIAFNKKLKKALLVNAQGFTLYLYTADYQRRPTCYDNGVQCSKVWPPLRTLSAPRAGAGVKASLLTMVKRTDGADQVMYNGHPLYTLKGAPNAVTGDKKPGDANGEGAFQVWFAVSPKGTAIKR